MSVALVRPINSTTEAVHASDDDWKGIVARWLTEEGHPNPQEGIENLVEVIDSEKIKPWLVLTTQGIALVPPHDFVNHFEDVNAAEVMDEVWMKRREHSQKGYTAVHDDVHGLAHLISESVLTLMNLPNLEPGVAGDRAQTRDALLVSASLLVAGVDLIDRGESKDLSIPRFYSRAEATQHRDDWLKLVGDYLVALDDLQGQAQDESKADTEPEEAIDWAREQFKQIFRVTED